MSELRVGATRELLAFSTTPVAPSRPRRRNKEPESWEARTVHELSVLAGDAWERAERVAEATVRFVPRLPHELLVVDEEVTAFSLPDPVAGGSRLTTIVVAHPALAQTCKLAFEAVWEQAFELDQARDRVRALGRGTEGTNPDSTRGEDDEQPRSRAIPGSMGSARVGRPS